MKKILILLITVATAISCGTPKTVQDSKRVIKGTWSLDNVNYSKSGNYNITLLNDTSAECFEGSTWNFVPNNNTGVYSINNENCPSGDRNFVFTIQQIDQTTGLYDFLLKPTNAKNKSANDVGFRLRLSQLNQNSMQWEQTVTLEGQPFKINMNFSKIQE